MKKILILYTSKYGSTDRYAHLLYDELKGENDVTISTLKNFRGKAREYDTIIYGAGIKSYVLYDYNKFARLIKKVDRIQTEVIVYGVGMMSATTEYARRIVEINKITSDIKFFYLRGAIYLEKLKGFDASIVKHLVSSLMLRTDLTYDEKAFISACLHGKDWVCKDNVMRIKEYVVR